MKNTGLSSRNQRNGLWTRSYLLAWLASLFLFMAFDSMVPVLPLYMEIREGIAGAAGWPLAALTLGALLSRPFAGWALDVYGRKAILWGGLLLFLVPAILYIWMLPAYILVALRFFQGIGFGVSNTALFTLASDIIPPHKMGEGMGYFSATMSISTAISPAAASWMLYRYDYQPVFAVAALTIALCLILTLLIKYPAFKAESVPPRLILISGTVLKSVLVVLPMALIFSSVMSFLPVYATMQGIAVTGIYYTVMATTSFLVRPLAGMLVDRKQERGFDVAVLVGTAALIVAVLIVVRISSLLLLSIGGFFYGIGFGFLQPTMLTLSVRDVPQEQRGAANATYWTAFDFGIFAGSIIWGLLARAAGYRAMFYLTAIPSLFALLWYFAHPLRSYFARIRSKRSGSGEGLNGR